jgi:hypothetical protein
LPMAMVPGGGVVVARAREGGGDVAGWWMVVSGGLGLLRCLEDWKDEGLVAVIADDGEVGRRRCAGFIGGIAGAGRGYGGCFPLGAPTKSSKPGGRGRLRVGGEGGRRPGGRRLAGWLAGRWT